MSLISSAAPQHPFLSICSRRNLCLIELVFTGVGTSMTWNPNCSNPEEIVFMIGKGSMI